ncbi:MAG: DUF3794 domain-containing protein [Clostridia bacterium]|nr:DUF3794 domain-containing protein [Clostridia bacterium]
MANQPVFENVPVFTAKEILTDKIKAECRTEISTESINRIINIKSNSIITDYSVLDKKIKYNGEITFFICYIDSENTVKKCECGAQFSGEINSDKITENSKVFIYSERQKTEANAGGVMLSVLSYIEVKAEIRERAFSSLLIGGEDLIVKQTSRDYTKSFGVKTGSYALQEDIDYNYKIEEVISNCVNTSIIAVQCGVGTIIVDGEVFLNCVFLQSGEKKCIIKESSVFPFRAEIECEEAMPSAKAIATAFVKSFKSDIFVDEEKNISRQSIAVSIKLEGEAFVLDTLTLAEDVFDIKNNIDIEKEKVSSFIPLDIKSFEKEISSRVPLDVEDGAVFSLTTNEEASVKNIEKVDGGIKVYGELDVNALFIKDEQIISRKIDMPFEALLENEDGDEFRVDSCVKDCSLAVLSNTESEVKLTMKFTLFSQQKTEFTAINKITIKEEKEINDNAISVYIPFSGEELWSLSKRLNCDPEILATLNPDLQFPLTGEERIVVYRQK